MALSVGTRLGSYEIADKLGAGGMGEVYRATDTNLKRDIAIKILPSTLAEDADRLVRFQREAEVLASLNHPNIAQIHGLERSDGTTALVMELVEGPTLADRIAQGPIPPEEALAIAMQIADALEAAHKLQIVHRDLKPANIKLRPDGTVKVLDFGIAKALEVPQGASGGARTPSLTTPAMTEAGVLLGTAAYMSPEQARGKAVDPRADIWAFGCVLYEMLTGQPAFAGEDVPTTLARVLAEDMNLGSIPATISPTVRHTIAVCLEKDVGKRIADIRDVKLALEGTFESTPQSPANKTTVARPFWRWALPISAALVVVALLAAGLTSRLMELPPLVPAPVARFAITPPATAPLADLGQHDVTISPDGKRIAYVAQDPQKGDVELYVRDLDGLNARVVADTEAVQTGSGDVDPFFSPDGQWIAFRSPGQGIMRVSLNGEPPRKVLDRFQGVFTGTWTRDGTLIYSSADNAGLLSLYRVSARGGGTPERLAPPARGTNGPPQLERLEPVLLPGGRAVLFTLSNGSSGRIAVLNLATDRQRILIEDGVEPSYAGTGDIVFVRGTTLMAVPFDLDRLAVTGQPVALLQGIRRPAGNGADYALSNTGTLVYVPDTAKKGSALVWVDRDGRVVGRAVNDLIDNPRNPRLSPDGRRVVVTTGPNRNGHLWVYDLSGRPSIPLETQGDSILTVWSPDSTRIAYFSSRGGGNVYIAPADGSVTNPMPVRHDVLEAGPDVWSSKGDLILDTGGKDIVATSANGKGKVRDVVATPAAEYDPALSPNGRWLAYTSTRTGRPEIWVRKYPHGVAAHRVSTNGGREPVWSHDGKELFYRQGNAMMAVPVKAQETFSWDPPVKLFTEPHFKFTTDPYTHTYDVARNGRFLMIQPSANFAPAHIVVVQNWFQELKRRMSTK